MTAETPARINLLDMTPREAREQLAAFFGRIGEPAYRAGQVVRRLWQNPAASFDAIYTGGCLHHMREEWAAPEIARVLRDHGRFAAIKPWRTPLHTIGTRLVGKREPNAHCSPLTSSRIAEYRSAFTFLKVSHHGPLLRYIALGVQKISGRGIPPSIGMRLGKLDDRLPIPARLGGSVAILGGCRSSL